MFSFGNVIKLTFMKWIFKCEWLSPELVSQMISNKNTRITVKEPLRREQLVETANQHPISPLSF